MPTMSVRPVDGQVNIGDDISLPLAVFTGMAPIDGENGVTKTDVRLQDARVSFKARPNGHDTDVEYTVSVVVTRKPITDAEAVRVGIKADLQKAAKVAKDEKTEADRKAIIRSVQETERAATAQVIAISQDSAKTMATVLAQALGHKA